MHAILCLLFSLASTSLAVRPHNPLPIAGRHVTGPDSQGESHIGRRQNAPPGTDRNPAVGYFEQPIDHHNPSLGTFKMRYFYSKQYWKGPGSPIVVFLPGEADAAPYVGYYGNWTLTNFNTAQGQLAYNLGAAFLLLENRYYGESSPYSELTTANLKYLTVDQVMRDTVNFAKNVKLPFDANSTASNVPWVLIGGSYSADITTFIARKMPGTYWAYYAASAVPHKEEDFWQQSLSLQQAGPKNCTKDAAQVIDHIDSVLTHGSPSEIDALKDNFGLQNLTHNEDFVNALATDPQRWYSNQLGYFQDPGTDTIYFWCDAVEGAWDPVTRNYTHSTLPGAEGVGVEKALKNWGKWFKYYVVPGYCKNNYGYPGLYSENSTYCWDSYDPQNPFLTDITVGNPWSRQFLWLLCNERLGQWNAGAPKGTPTLISRLLNYKYGYHMCSSMFPKGPNGETYGLRTTEQFNEYYGDWFVENTTHLLLTNGEYDYWRPWTVASEQRPGGPQKSTEQVPTWIVPGGFHVSDFLQYSNGRINPGVQKVIDEVLVQLEAWVKEWPGKKVHSTS